MLLENSESLKDMEALSLKGFKTIALAEQSIRDVEVKHRECQAQWQKHEELCRQQLPGAYAPHVELRLASGDLTGLWKSDACHS